MAVHKLHSLVNLLLLFHILVTNTRKIFVGKCYNALFGFLSIFMSVRFFDLSPNLAQHSTPNQAIVDLWVAFYHHHNIKADAQRLICGMDAGSYQQCKAHWQNLDHQNDQALTDWLITLFNGLFTGKTFDKTP